MPAKRIFDTLYTARFLNLLNKDFSQWRAYRMGIIDRKGNVLKKPEGNREKKEFTAFHRLVATIKQALNKVPGANTVATIYTAYKSFVEEYDISYDDQEKIFEEMPSLHEAVTAGDSGGDPDKQASGETSGSITLMPGKLKKKKKKTLKEFIED